MDPHNSPQNPQEEYNPNLDAQDEEVLSGGNNRLTYIMLALIVALVAGYIALPKGKGSGMAAVTPSFMLNDAAVSGAVPPAEDSAAAPAAAAPAAAAPAKPPASAAKPATTSAAAGAPAAAPAAAPAEPAAAPVAEAAPAAAPAPAPEPAAPATATLNGKIEDENGRPLAGATIFLKGSNKMASTDASGLYSIEISATGDNVLTYGYGGYEDETMTVRGAKPVNVTLVPRAKAGRKRR